jgi:creatinine amidohydrolase
MPAYDTEVEWGRLPAAAIRRRAEADAIVLIPIGATEQHGPHLPTMVDHRLVFEVACRGARMIAEREPVLVTPVIPFGMSEHHVSLGGTITLDYATMAAVLGCVVDSAIRQGFRRLFVLNGHGGNIAPLEAIVAELTVRHHLPIACAAYWQVAEPEIAGILEKQTRVLHACEAETSMIWAAAPETVDAEIISQCHGALVPGLAAIPGVNPGVYRWRQLGTRSPNGVIGEAGAASRDKGERLLEAAAKALAAALLEPALWSAAI